MGIYLDSKTGHELACVPMIFTGQVWNKTLNIAAPVFLATRVVVRSAQPGRIA